MAQASHFFYIGKYEFWCPILVRHISRRRCYRGYVTVVTHRALSCMTAASLYCRQWGGGMLTVAGDSTGPAWRCIINDEFCTRHPGLIYISQTSISDWMNVQRGRHNLQRAMFRLHYGWKVSGLAAGGRHLPCP